MKWSIQPPRDPQSVTPDWNAAQTPAIDGVFVREPKYVITENGMLLELLRGEWLGVAAGVDQVFMRLLDPGRVSAWHAHAKTTDRLFCVGGRALVVLYDARTNSPTSKTLAEYRLAPERPMLLVVPPGVFHGVKAIGDEPLVLLNMVDVAYEYAKPDHWRLPADAPDIPYNWN